MSAWFQSCRVPYFQDVAKGSMQKKNATPGSRVELGSRLFQVPGSGGSSVCFKNLHQPWFSGAGWGFQAEKWHQAPRALRKKEEKKVESKKTEFPG